MKKCVILFLALAFAAGAAELPLKLSLLENDILWVRASSVTGNFTEQLRSGQPTNKLSGLVLDLRFADGTNVVAGDYFTNRKPALVILVGRQTRGAALALAGQLRQAGDGIVIGAPNEAGTLSPDLMVSVPADEEKLFWENPFAQTATNAAAVSSTNNLLALVDHTSEAELVRKRVKDGDDDEVFTPTPRAPMAKPVIRDPALARAVDLLKALAALRPSQG